MDYQIWNDLIGRFYFGADCAGEDVFLTVDREALREIAGPVHAFGSAEAAADDFRQAVREELVRRPSWEPRYELPRAFSEEVPSVFGLAALQVLAVYEMRDTDRFTDKAYWPRLAELLSFPGRPYALPLGKIYENHRSLWRDHLARWANDRRYHAGARGRLVVPRDVPGSGARNICLPLSQALLRLADLQSLAGQLGQVGCVPGDETLDGPTVARWLERLLRRGPGLTYLPDSLRRAGRSLGVGRDLQALCAHLLQQGGAALSRHALRVFSDDRCEPASEQLAQFIYRGGAPGHRAVAGGRAALPPALALRAWLHVRARSHALEGGLLLRRADAGWDRVDGPGLGDLLAWGLKGEWAGEWLPGPYRPLRAGFLFAVAGPEYTLERRHAAPGDRAMVLGPAPLIEKFQAGAAALAEGRRFEGYDGGLRGLPAGWRLLSLVLREDLREDEVPEAWQDLIQFRPQLRVEGGLALRRGVWMAGAAPRLRVVGAGASGARVVLDGVSHPVDAIGRAPGAEQALGAPGTYLLWIEGQRRLALRLVVEEASALAEGPPWAGWARPPLGWPHETGTPDTVETVSGPLVSGAWRPPAPATPPPRSGPDAALALERLLRRRGRWRLPTSASPDGSRSLLLHLLDRAAARGERPTEGKGSEGRDGHGP